MCGAALGLGVWSSCGEEDGVACRESRGTYQSSVWRCLVLASGARNRDTRGLMLLVSLFVVL
eukprot:7995040-Alexandrium_andersonii.AAC.1